MLRVTDAQLVEFINRRNLPKTDPRYVSREAAQFSLDQASRAARLFEAMASGKLTDDWIDNLLAGRLVRREEPAAASIVEATTAPPVPASVQLISTGNFVAALLHSKVWKHAKDPDGKVGMSETQYGDLWPNEVMMPAGYAGRYPHLLLRDDTVSLADLCACTDADFFTGPAGCSVQPGVSEFLMGPDGRRLTRAVTFWGYKWYLGRTVTDCRTEISASNIPLIHPDGPWVIIQYRSGILRRHAIDLPGSSRGDSLAPFVLRFNSARPCFSARRVGLPLPLCGSGFRGSEVISVP